jgi:hypothetical protein
MKLPISQDKYTRIVGAAASQLSFAMRYASLYAGIRAAT